MLVDFPHSPIDSKNYRVSRRSKYVASLYEILMFQNEYLILVLQSCKNNFFSGNINLFLMILFIDYCTLLMDLWNVLLITIFHVAYLVIVSKTFEAWLVLFCNWQTQHRMLLAFNVCDLQSWILLKTKKPFSNPFDNFASLT